MIINIIISVLILIAAIAFLDEVIEMWRAPDALTRVNLTGPATGVGVPLLIIANMIRSIADGDEWYVVLVKSVIAIVADGGLSGILRDGTFRPRRANQAWTKRHHGQRSRLHGQSQNNDGNSSGRPSRRRHRLSRGLRTRRKAKLGT